MKKAICIILFALCLSACSVSNTNNTGGTTTTTAAEASVTTAAEETEKAVLAVGETWEVKGQWKLTVTGVQETNERNQYSEKKPAAVYIVSCEYENLGYTDPSGIMSGLVFSLDESVVDSEKYMGYNYPATIVDYPQETPVGAKCKAQYCIGVDNAGDFQLNVEKYDGSDTKQCAVFMISAKDINTVKAGDNTPSSEGTETASDDEDMGWTRDEFMSYPVCYANKTIYKEPDGGSKQIGFVSKGETVTCIGHTNDDGWLVINWRGEVGFIDPTDVR